MELEDEEGSDDDAKARAHNAIEGSDMATLLRHSPCRLPLLKAGDCVQFDSRLLHAGSANSVRERRVIFYFSFRARSAQLPSGYESSLLEHLRGRYCLEDDGRLSERATPLS